MRPRSPRLPRFDGIPEAPHQRLVIMQVVDGAETRAEDLATTVQVVQVGPAVVAAGIAGALRIQRTGIVPISCISNAHHALGHEQVAITGVAGGQDAIEHVDSAHHRLDDVRRSAHAHQVARLLGGHLAVM